ncbi:unnamed protein product [Euphydryas editha]|nr:unnamed protein product [Euphydryas editha]
MVACFFGLISHVATVSLEQRRTVNCKWYTTICLPEVFVKIRKTNPRRRIIFHHDNASSHTSRQTSDFLSSQYIELMTRPPYSPDLTPNDFFFFSNIKEERKNCYGKWFERMQKCIDHQGEYFEKQ